ncbi:MAG: hypothetical protein IJA87_09025 [Clostridia bacterium]|nr:hypothetical protein [Clostridia bacterium]
MAVNKRYQEQMNSVEFSSDFENETVNMLLQTQRKKKGRNINMKKPIRIAIVAAVISLFAVSALALSGLLTPSQLAAYFKQEEAQSAFDNQTEENINQTVENSGYVFSLEGIAAGKELEYLGNNAVEAEKRYVVITTRKADSSEITFDDSITFVPLFEGYEPWRVNGLKLDGASVHKTIRNNVLYYLWEFSGFEAFADKKIYIAGFEGIAPSADEFIMNGDGSIDFSDKYEGTKVMFEIKLDSSKADSAKAEELINALG